jgi:small-conductance mechanosensitive channel
LGGVGALFGGNVVGVHLDWQQLAVEYLNKGLKIALILLLAYAGYRLVRIAANAVGKATDDEGLVRLSARRQHVDTIARLVKRTGAVFIVAVAALTILSELGISVAPLLASAGIVGVAVGLGTQNLIKDMLAGFFILLEDQFAVGDLITIAGITGTVEDMSLRRTTVRDFNGTLYVVSNSEIKVVSNANKDWARLIVDVGVAYETDLTRAMSVLEEVSKEAASAPEFQANVLEPPDVMGVMSLDDSAVTLRTAIKVEPGVQWALGRALRKQIKERFEREGIDMPYPQQVVHVKQ